MAALKISIPHQRFVFTGIGILLGLLSLIMPALDVMDPANFIGGTLVWAALLEIVHGFRRAESGSRTSAWISGAITMLIGILLLNAELFQRKPLIDFILILFGLDACRYGYIFFRKRKHGEPALTDLLSGLGNAIVIVLVLIFRGKGMEWVISLSGSLRIFGTVFNLYTARTGTMSQVAEDVAGSLGLDKEKDFQELALQVQKESELRAPIDRGWIISFIIILFFIHLGRMGLDRSPIAVLSPVVAVVGDIVIALIFSFGFIAPLRSIFKKATGSAIRQLWKWIQKVPESQRSKVGLRALARAWVQHDVSVIVGMRKSGYSSFTAVRNGLKIGLPFAALLAAVMPVLGMSWYFDTENWASGMWDGWAGSRTEVWREAMIKASGEGTGAGAFRLLPPHMTDTSDVSFVIIGDTGEGDPSQHILKDQLLAVSNKPDVDFVVVSSDVIYPSGAMRDYERKFFLPFKGLTKPVYAIPGNHDWYDALDGFVATFFKPDAARKALVARTISDLKLTSTTGRTVDQLIHEAAWLRKEYQVDAGHQTAPFFQVSNDYFVLLTIDTGVRRRLDELELAWVRSVMEASRGKYVMVLLGHPFYAIGEYQGNMTPEFHALHELLRAYNVPLIMAGDTHDMEYYKELPQGKNGRITHHFVNGGGGAYLSIGASMSPPDSRPTKDWAIYPARGPIINKIDSLTPRWKYPAWLWLKKYNGYPFSAEWLSAAFDYNQAPYFQSFMEIKVERSHKRIRLIPYGIHGQLRWSDFETGGNVKPSAASDSDPVEWVLPM